MDWKLRQITNLQYLCCVVCGLALLILLFMLHQSNCVLLFSFCLWNQSISVTCIKLQLSLSDLKSQTLLVGHCVLKINNLSGVKFSDCGCTSCFMNRIKWVTVICFRLLCMDISLIKSTTSILFSTLTGYSCKVKE